MWMKDQFRTWEGVAIGNVEIAVLERRPHSESAPKSGNSE